MRDRIRPGHPLSGTLRPDLSRPLSPSRPGAFPTLGLILFLLCSILRDKPAREFSHRQHHACPARDAQADRLCAVAGATQPDSSAVGGAAGSAIAERLDRSPGPAENGLQHGHAPLVQTSRLRRTSRPYQAARRAGRMLPRQGADVEVDRRKQVTASGSVIRRQGARTLPKPQRFCHGFLSRRSP